MTNFDLDGIRREITGYVGKKVRLTADKGRKRIVTREGILDAAYPNIFIVRVENEFSSERTVSYSYSDVFTSSVELTLC